MCIVAVFVVRLELQVELSQDDAALLTLERRN
jgi:hypothetical protein